MSHINYETMTDEELKQYVLSHRGDQAAFYAYLDRRHPRPNQTVISPDDPEFEAKLLASIQRQMERHQILNSEI